MALVFLARRLLSMTGIVLTTLLVGCSSGPLDVDDLGKLRGTVTYNGQPVVHGAVKFYNGGTLTCVAAIDKDGSYSTTLVPGEYTVAIDTAIEPREAAKMAREGPTEMIGRVGGRMPVRRKNEDGDVQVVKNFDPYDRLPTLDGLLATLTPDEKSRLEAVQKRYGTPEASGLTLKVRRGALAHDFALN
jgi:hypothetical protein